MTIADIDATPLPRRTLLVVCCMGMGTLAYPLAGLSLFLKPIGQDMGLTETQMGFLVGVQMIGLIGAILITGFLADRMGFRIFLCLGAVSNLVGFLVMSQAEGFVVLPYIHADPTLAKNLEDAGCATVMPLGSAIGSGQGIHTTEEIKIIIEQAKVPVIVDAGLAVPSDASHALELGASAVLVNTAIAQAENPALMGEAFRHGVEAGRKAYLSGRIGVRHYAAASSPTTDVPQPVQVRS